MRNLFILLLCCLAMPLSAADRDIVVAESGTRWIQEAVLPSGFPGPGPLGTVDIRDYPAYRAAQGPGFWPLFQHIQQQGIPMTTPVEMTLTRPSSEPSGYRMSTMRFCYPNPQTGSLVDGAMVDVVDVASGRYVSIAHRGPIRPDLLERLTDQLTAHADANGLLLAPAPRILGYNSPMIPAHVQLWEVQFAIVTAPNAEAALGQD